MTLEEALTVGLISIEDLQKMREGFSMSGLERYIVGKTVTSKSDGPGMVISVHTDLPFRSRGTDTSTSPKLVRGVLLL